MAQHAFWLIVSIFTFIGFGVYLAKTEQSHEQTLSPSERVICIFIVSLTSYFFWLFVVDLIVKVN